MQQCRVEKNRVALAQRQLHMVEIKKFLERGLPGHQITRQVLLRMRQVQRGAAFHRHVHMRYRTLQRQSR